MFFDHFPNSLVVTNLNTCPFFQSSTTSLITYETKVLIIFDRSMIFHGPNVWFYFLTVAGIFGIVLGKIPVSKNVHPLEKIFLLGVYAFSIILVVGFGGLVAW